MATLQRSLCGCVTDCVMVKVCLLIRGKGWVWVWVMGLIINLIKPTVVPRITSILRPARGHGRRYWVEKMFSSPLGGEGCNVGGGGGIVCFSIIIRVNKPITNVNKQSEQRKSKQRSSDGRNGELERRGRGRGGIHRRSGRWVKRVEGRGRGVCVISPWDKQRNV